MRIDRAIIAVYSEAATRDSFNHFPILSFPALFAFLVSVAALVYWSFWKKR